MEAITALITFIAVNKVAILGALLGISELLALTPLKANGLFHATYLGLKKLAGK